MWPATPDNVLRSMFVADSHNSTRVSTNYLHKAVLIGEGNLTKGETKNF